MWLRLGNFSHFGFFVGNIFPVNLYSRSMQDEINRRILKAFLVVMKPIARMLLRCGVGFREFSEVAKVAFVDVASAEYGIRGRPTNISRVAVMTGLTRKEVRRLRDKLEAGEQTVSLRSTPLSEVLHRWHSEKEFLDDTGGPAVLPFSGDSPTFSELVKKFGGDIPAGAMRTELKRIEAIEEQENGELKLVKRTVFPHGLDEKMMVSLIHGAYPMLETIAHNIDPDRKEDTWAQITAFSRHVRKSDLRRIRRISKDRLTDVAATFDDLFMAYETLHENEDADADQNLVAVGAFYFEESGKPSESDW